MATPGRDSTSGAVTTRVMQRAGASPPGAPTTPAESLKHVYSGITLTRDHLATVLGCLRDCCLRVDIHANTFQLTDLDQLEAVISEDKIIERLRITAVDPHDGEMTLAMQLGYVEIEASNASWAPAFRIIARLLDGIPKNGTTMCGITMRRSAIGASQPAAAALPSATRPAVPAPPASARAPSTPTALAVAAMTAAASPASAERTRTQAGDRQRSVVAGARGEGPPAAGGAMSPPSSLAGSARAAQSPAPGPGIAAASGAGVAGALRSHAPVLLHGVGALALLACVGLHWRRIAAGMDATTATLIGIAVLCIGGACIWTLARKRGSAPRS